MSVRAVLSRVADAGITVLVVTISTAGVVMSVNGVVVSVTGVTVTVVVVVVVVVVVIVMIVMINVVVALPLGGSGHGGESCDSNSLKHFDFLIVISKLI